MKVRRHQPRKNHVGHKKPNNLKKSERLPKKRRSFLTKWTDTTYFLVAYMYQLKDDLENALKYYRYVFKKKHPYPEVFINVGEYYGRKLNDLDNNIGYYIRAVKAAGRDVDYRGLLARTVHDLG